MTDTWAWDFQAFIRAPCAAFLSLARERYWNCNSVAGALMAIGNSEALLADNVHFAKVTGAGF